MGKTPQLYRNEGCANQELGPQTRTDGPFKRLVHCLHQDDQENILREKSREAEIRDE